MLLNKYIVTLTKTISAYNTQQVLDQNLKLHKASLNSSLEIIKSLKKNDFDTTKNIKNNIQFVDSNKSQNFIDSLF